MNKKKKWIITAIVLVVFCLILGLYNLLNDKAPASDDAAKAPIAPRRQSTLNVNGRIVRPQRLTDGITTVGNLLPDEEEENRIYHLTRTFLAEQGYERYEISNYAREGYECRHNVGYWRRTEYLGLGLGAASLYRGQRFSVTSDMEEYLRDSDLPEKIHRDVETLTRADQMEEFMFLGLRMMEGVSETEFQRQFGCAMDSIYGRILEKYRNEGFLQKRQEFWSLTEKGIHVSNYILADFLLDQ